MAQNSPIKQTHIILVRHGQIQANIDKKWHGSTDSALTQHGHLQAQKAAARLIAQHPDVSAIYSSPLSRTRHTALAIAEKFNKDVLVEDNLREYGIGALEGTPFNDLLETHRFFEKLRQDFDYAPSGGESINQVGNRISATFRTLVERHPGQKIIAVSHGAVMALGLALLLHDDPMEWERYHFQNTGISELVLGDQPKLVLFNCATHLEV